MKQIDCVDSNNGEKICNSIWDFAIDDLLFAYCRSGEGGCP